MNKAKTRILGCAILLWAGLAPTKAEVIVPVVEDTYVGNFSNWMNENFGEKNGLSVLRNASGLYLSYIKIDAFALPRLRSVEGLSLYNLGTAPNLPIQVYLLQDLDPASWSADLLTWINAPGVGTDFSIDASVGPILLGERSSWTVAGRNEIPFTNDAGKRALREQLNSGSRQATLVITGTDWVSGSMNFYSIDERTPDTEPYVVAE